MCGEPDSRPHNNTVKYVCWVSNGHYFDCGTDPTFAWRLETAAYVDAGEEGGWEPAEGRYILGME